MAVVILDPRFPAMLPVDAYPLLSGDVSYTAEVPVRVQWHIADFGGHVVDSASVLVTTNRADEEVLQRWEKGDKFIVAPTLAMDDGPEALEGPKSGNSPAAVEAVAESGAGTEQDDSTTEPAPDFSGVPVSVLEDIARAIALTSRAYRQGEWESSQTHESLLPYLQEEAAEYVSAVNEWTKNPSEQTERQLCSELGDLLLQVLFHAEIANRRGVFDIGHVALSYVEKMRRRAPYYFGDDETMVSTEEQDRIWAEAKVAEKKNTEPEPADKPSKSDKSGDTAASSEPSSISSQSSPSSAASTDD